MLAKLHDKAFDREGWIFEIKWDGYRAIAEVNGKNSRMYSRNGLAFENEYAVVFDELNRIKKKMVLDGELVAFGENGMPSFQAIQQYDPATTPLVYYVFDILYLNGKSLENSPLLERKQILKDLLPESDIIKYCDHIETYGLEFFELMQQQGLEGMIAKRGDSRYIEDSRSSDWLKVKHMLTDEAVIAGYTAPRGGRSYFGALILGSYEKGKLKYIGHTGTGFTQKTLKEVHAKLQELETDESPFDEKVKVNSPVTWVKPKLVCNLKFTEVTADGNRRHPVFMGLRKDKAAKEVKLEAPVAKDKTEPVTAQEKAMEKTTTVGGKKLALTNLDKVYWPDEGYTKGDVINYYSEMAKHMIKYLKGRPESLMRTPNGITGGAFYHKDAGEHAPDWMETYPVWSESSNKTVDYLVCNDKPSLLYIANLGCIEINPWNSTIKHPDNPDYFIMDIDPSEKNTFDQVVECAQVIKEILDKAGAESYCKTSGSTGLHIYVPLGAKYTYEEAKQFAEMIAQFAQEQLPDFTTLERSLSKRGKDQIYIDYLQNRRGQTLSSVYSLRPKPGAPVSTPLEWKEVKKGLHPTDFNIENIFKRIEKKGDLFAPVLGKGIDMLKAIKKLAE
ncbi:DNA ligase D [Polluticoccus soli]|uniref:DNA ligase D n=1 Tax=Polluticoccus soli TaxID=3034150 RepID=UPI0023E1C989|nr:DNA ligase D [Flavipsychrobacter sp. JY13-12]